MNADAPFPKRTIFIKIKGLTEFKSQIILIINFKNMFESFLTRILSLFLGSIFLIYPVSLHASDIDVYSQELEEGEIVEDPDQMTQKEINDLFGEDPYLGQTSYLQSPDGFSQRKNSK